MISQYLATLAHTMEGTLVFLLYHTVPTLVQHPDYNQAILVTSGEFLVLTVPSDHLNGPYKYTGTKYTHIKTINLINTILKIRPQLFL